MKNRGLGRGLSALIAETKIESNNLDSHNNRIINIDIMVIEAGKFQPRKYFNEEAIGELADSIMRHGIIQPIIVRKIPHSAKYEIIAGERRWRAAKISGLTEIPVIVRDIDEASVAEQSIIENIQRENLNPLEEADAYVELMGSHKYTQEDLSKALGKKRTHIANMMRLVSLPESVKSYIMNEQLSFGHAKVIASCEDVEAIAKEIVSKNLNVRQTEHLIKNWKKKNSIQGAASKPPKDNNSNEELVYISASLSEKLGLKVSIDAKGASGKLVINYNNYEQLDKLVEKLTY